MFKRIEPNRALKEKIADKGLKQGWIAKKAEVNQADFSQICNGIKNPTLKQAINISAVLECAIEDIF